MSNINDLISVLKKEKKIYIQTHNFPDHDAVASAFGLQEFFKKFGIISFIIYEGEIQRDSLKTMIKKLNIDIKHNSKYNITEEDKIVIVDGCKGNKNVTDLIGDEVGVIDHHNVKEQEDVAFHDIRSDYGACSSIIFDYFHENDFKISQEIATALLIGINMDTALLTRGVSESDINAYYHLYSFANIRMINSILRNYIQQKDLQFYKYAIENVKIEREVAFCCFANGCNQNLMGIIGDFLLALKEVDFVILCAKNDNRINFSIRSERNEWDASKVIQESLKGIGFGGGHSDMAGGIIKDINLFKENEIYTKFISNLK